MKTTKRYPMFAHFRRRILTGFLLIAPLAATLIVLKLLFSGLANVLAPLSASFLGQTSPVVQTLVSALLLLVLIYLVGLAGSNLAGRWVIGVSEKLFSRIPLIGSIYSGARQIIHTFGSRDDATFKQVVWVHYPTSEVYSIGFVTGNVIGADKTTLLKIFIPTAPNPTSGFLVVSRPDDVVDSNMSVDSAIQMILSGGIVSPDQVTVSLSSESHN